MGLELVREYGGNRVGEYPAQPTLFDEQTDTDDESQAPEGVELDLEYDADDWQGLDVTVSTECSAKEWGERPTFFVDGKDVGRTIAWMRAPNGQPIPVRLSQIGSIVMELADGYCRRVFHTVDRVVTMVADPFPWDQVESFAAELQTHGFRLLIATPPEGLSYDFEKMRKVTQNRSNTEMARLEEIAVSRIANYPGIVDGRLEPRSGGLDRRNSPVFGLIKTHYQNYLHPQGLELLYQLGMGQRTPIFTLPHDRFPVASWYLRLSGGGETPNWGIVRIEAPLDWIVTKYPNRSDLSQFANNLSYVIGSYRSKEQSYGRAAVSLHPIVRAEESLGAVFSPSNALNHRLYRLLGI